MTKSQNTKNEQQKDLCITVEKQVWESTLRRSMELQAENYKLKDVITEMCCQLVDDDDDMSLGLAEYFDQDLLIKIREDLIVAGGAPFYPDTIKELEK